jgi:hypothetical protein
MGQPGPIARAGQTFYECRAYPSSGSARGAGRQFGPVFKFEIRDSIELLGVIGHERVRRDEEMFAPIIIPRVLSVARSNS